MSSRGRITDSDRFSSDDRRCFKHAMPSRKRRKHETLIRTDPIDLTADESDESDQHREPDAKVGARSGANVTQIDDEDEDEIQFVEHRVRQAESPRRAAQAQPKTINDVLRDRNAASTVPKQLPPLVLALPAQVAQNTPCTLHFDVLPSELAASLFRAMLGESSKWQRNKWYLNDRQVESPHTTAFYSAEPGQDASHWYMGRKAYDENEGLHAFLPEMLQAREIIERIVNEELARKHRFPLEFDGSWSANVAAANCYRGATETVGAHADQLTYLGPYPTIASLSLGVQRTFRLRAVPSLQAPEAPPPRTYDVVLPHNSLCIMGAGCQEHFKHSIPPARSIDVFKLRRSDGTVETYVERINVRQSTRTSRLFLPKRQFFDPACACGRTLR